MKSRQKNTLYPLMGVFVGVSMVAVGLLLHNGLGALLLFIGLLGTLATLYIWSAVAMWKTHRPSPQANPTEENKIEGSSELAPTSRDGETPIPMPENGNTLLRNKV